MKIVDLKKEAIEVTKEDWHMLGELAMGFQRVCDHYICCDDCPLRYFHDEHELCPSKYLFDLIAFLDD